jgi:hypothetical protein
MPQEAARLNADLLSAATVRGRKIAVLRRLTGLPPTSRKAI